MDIFDVNRCPWKCVCGKKDTQFCDSTCPRYIKYNYLVENSLLEEEWYMPKEFIYFDDGAQDSYKRCLEIKENIVDFVKSGKSIIIWSETTGTGKTHMSIRMLLSWFGAVWDSTPFVPRGMFIDVMRLFTEQRRTFEGHQSDYLDFVNENIKRADLVVFDDICQNEKLTPFQNELMFRLINAREVANKASIYTSNRKMDDLLDCYGDRLFSRIVRPAEIIQFSNVDKRGIL